MADLKVWLDATRPGGTSSPSGDFGAVAFYDATNTTREQREWVRQQLSPMRCKIIFIESICEDGEVEEANITASKVSMPDYDGVSAEEAVADFKARIAAYRAHYEQVREVGHSWIKMIDGGRELRLNNVTGFLPSRIAQFLVNLHTHRRSFYFSRHGQSEYNQLGRIGGDSGLTSNGEAYATELAGWVERQVVVGEDGAPVPCRLWTSSLQRTIQTAQHIAHPTVTTPAGEQWVQMRPKVFRNLDEIYAGVRERRGAGAARSGAPRASALAPAPRTQRERPPPSPAPLHPAPHPTLRPPPSAPTRRPLAPLRSVTG